MPIRLATADDAPAIAAIYRHYVDETVVTFEEEAPDAGEIARRMATCHAYLVAAEDDRVLGYAYGNPHHARAAYAWGCDVTVYLEPSAGGRGLGRALYSALLPLLSACGLRRAYGLIALPNEASVGLHEAFGFRLAGVWERTGWKHERWIDVGVWQLDLGDDSPPGELFRAADLPADALPAALRPPQISRRRSSA